MEIRKIIKGIKVCMNGLYKLMKNLYLKRRPTEQPL